MFKLTNADNVALNNSDRAYFCNKGAKLYGEKKYKDAIEYYRIAMALEDVQSISNIGYCYLYARDIEKNVDLAIAYFKIAAHYGNLDATYKLGNIYELGEDIEKDNEIAAYYYEKGIKIYEEADCSEQYEYRHRYPSLFLAIGRGHMKNGILYTDIEQAYKYLKLAKEGFETALEEGFDHYKDHYEETVKLLDDSCFEKIKAEEQEDDYNEEDE